MVVGEAVAVYHNYEEVTPFGRLTAAEVGIWQPPALRRPDWCDKLIGVNVAYGKLANHPCNYCTAEYGPRIELLS